MPRRAGAAWRWVRPWSPAGPTPWSTSVAAPLLAAGVKLFPKLADGQFEIAAGVRAATPDGLPMAGWSANPGVVLAVGARRNGWLLAPLVAEIVVACVTGRDPGPYGARLDPARFRQ